LAFVELSFLGQHLGVAHLQSRLQQGGKEIAPVPVSTSTICALKIGVLELSTLQEQSFKDGVAQVEVVKVI
jgi:hypothetical protein